MADRLGQVGNRETLLWGTNRWRTDAEREAYERIFGKRDDIGRNLADKLIKYPEEKKRDEDERLLRKRNDEQKETD